MPDPVRIQPRPWHHWLSLAASRGGNLADLALVRAGLDQYRVEQWVPTQWPAWASTVNASTGERRTLPPELVEKLRSMGHNPRRAERDPDLDRPPSEVQHLRRVARERGLD